MKPFLVVIEPRGDTNGHAVVRRIMAEDARAAADEVLANYEVSREARVFVAEHPNFQSFDVAMTVKERA